MVRSRVVLGLFGAAWAGACDSRPLRYAGPGNPDGAAVQLDGGAGGSANGGTIDAADAGPIAPPSSSVSVGDNFSCALRADSTAACWGFNGNGQATPPPDKLTSISAGGRFACGLRLDGSIACWGANDQNQSMPPPGTGFVQVSAGKTHACALTADGAVSCWGSAPFARDMERGPFSELASGTDFTCGVERSGFFLCWGRLGNVSTFPDPVPTFTKISARGRRLCGLDPRDGHAVCLDWDANSPPDLPTGHFTQLGVGGDSACALRDNGQVVCWSMVRGQPLAASNQPPAGSFAAISIGATHSCARDARGAITCWGGDPIAGHAPLVGRFSDVSVSGSGGIAVVEGTHGCAQRTDGTLTCWGYEANLEASAPAGVFKQMSVGLISSCGIRASDSSIVCWGDRNLGEGDPPVLAGDRVAVGFGFACATEPDNSVRCWGLNWNIAAMWMFGPATWLSAGYTEACYIFSGKILCAESQPGAPPPGDIPPDGSFQQVETDGSHRCAISSPDGSIVCWGGNSYGESTPPAGGGYRGLAVGDAAGGGGAHSCAIGADGHVTCWGDHAAGKCNPPDQTFVRIDAAENYTCGVSTAGQVWCWGLQARQPLD